MDMNDRGKKPLPTPARRLSFPDSRGAYKNIAPQSSESPSGTEFKSPGIHVVDGGNSGGPSDNASDADDSDEDEEAGLNPEGKRKRKERKERNTSISGRVAGMPITAKEERKLADMAVLKRSLVNILLIALWYSFSLSISIVSLAS